VTKSQKESIFPSMQRVCDILCRADKIQRGYDKEMSQVNRFSSLASDSGDEEHDYKDTEANKNEKISEEENAKTMPPTLDTLTWDLGIPFSDFVSKKSMYALTHSVPDANGVIECDRCRERFPDKDHFFAHATSVLTVGDRISSAGSESRG
jgi:hypothetical protein